MFASLFHRVNESLVFETVALLDGAELPDAATCEAVLITGSPFGVYDDPPWIEPLRGFIRAAADAMVPMVGICFGHQIIADALGGDVRKSEKGWGVGRHTYEITQKPEWMGDAEATFALAVSHKDQVITPPPNVRTLAHSAHTDHALLVYEDAPILTMQGHPEFGDAYSIALYNARRGSGLGDELADAAIESMSQPEDNVLAAEWMVRFLSAARLGAKQL